MKGPVRTGWPTRRGAAAAGAAACLFVAAVAARQNETAWQDPFVTGDPALYPSPQAIETIPRAAEVKRNPSMVRIPADVQPLAAGENESVRIELLQVIRGDEIAGTPAPPDMDAMVLVTRWTNVHPRERVERSKLEGKTDRTYGAGGLFSGGGPGASEARVELDVPYKVPKASQHLFLAAGGIAHDLNPGAAALPNGVAPDAAFSIARFGESREFRFAYLLPREAKDIALRFFDYNDGHVVLPVAGDAEAAMAGDGPANALDRANIGGLEIAVTGLKYAGEHAGVMAPEGWRFAQVELFGRSDARQGGKGAIATIDPTKYSWLAGDGGYVWYGLPPRDGERVVSFTPELFQRRQLVFLVPDDIERFRLGLRGRKHARLLKATPQEPAPLPPAAVTHTDGEALDLALLGLRWESDWLVADLAVMPIGDAKGVELSPGRQFLVADGGGAELPVDTAATKRLARRPPSPAVVPPGTSMRFELAFSAPADFAPAILNYRGFAGAGVLDLSALPVAGTRGAATPHGAADFPDIKAGTASSPAVAAAPQLQMAEQAAGGNVEVVSSARRDPPAEPPRLMPVKLPPFDAATAVGETEPNDKLEEATPFGAGYGATGTLAGKDDDWFLLQVEGEPQLWTFEASGPGVGSLSVYRTGNMRLAERRVSKGQTSIRIDNVLLLPGPYWLQLRPARDGGEYSVRAVPLGRPDRYAESEPNDKTDHAHFLRFGEPRQGLIDHKDDRDLYRFSLDRMTHLAVSVTPPPEKEMLLDMEREGWRVTSQRTTKPGDTMRYQALLDAGDYELMLRPNGDWRSDTPYEVRLDRLDPFELPLDLEPNDSEYDARPLGGRRNFTGNVGAFGKVDWYRLPPVARDTALTVTVEGDDGTRAILYSQDGERIRSSRLDEDREQKTSTSRVYGGILKPGADGLLKITGAGSYQIHLAYDPSPVEETGEPAEADIALTVPDSVPVFNAYGKELQQAALSLSVTNNGEASQRLFLESMSGESGWEIALEAAELDLAAGESQTVSGTLRALPDRPAGRPVPIFLRAHNVAGAGATGLLTAEAACDAPPVAPRRYEALPEALRGGFNLAWTALGGEAAADSDSARNRFVPLFDGFTPLNDRYDIAGDKMPFDVTIRLAGGGDAEIAGVVLFPRAVGQDQGNLGPFEILASADGKAFSPVFSGYLNRNEVEQAFVFDQPVRASHMRLRVKRAKELNGRGKAGLGEWKVIAVPGSRPFGDRALNIAAPSLGGHIVWASWEAGYRYRAAMLTEEKDAPKTRVEALQPIEWVAGFHHERAARITRLAWRDVAKASARDRHFESIKVSVSTEGPTGPWQPVADWRLERDDDGNAELVLDEPVWARFVRFSAPGSDQRADWLLPETLRIFEQPAGGGYRSILSEWGHYARDAAFERPDETAQAVVLEDRGGSGPDQATVLAVGDVLGGRVQVGTDEDWFRIEVPGGMERLEFAFDGAGAGRLIPTLQDSDSNPVTLVEGNEIEGARVFHAEVTAGESYWLRVREARRSIMIAWDNSGSVSAYHATMYRAIVRFIDDIRPGLEVVNLLPFRDREPVPLLEEWTDDPLALKRAIGSYDRKDGSSESEKTLIGAMTALAERQGNRGIVLLTDANSGGDRMAAEMWRLFQEVRPRVFALQLELAHKELAHFQDLMQDWTAVNNGYYSVFRDQADLDVAFDRAACHLRRPAEYRVALRKGPGPGTLRVLWEEGKVMAGATVELILDASGSMRSRKNKVDGKLKIDVAKDVMSEIIGLLPDDSQVGLRVYGHRKKEGTKGDCQDSQLVVGIGDLDRKALLSAVSRIKALGTTPIAYSLEQAGKDLARVEGPKLIVLVTDGKEECKADPAAVVKQLKDEGIDVRVDIVGFALAEEKVKEDMLRAAEAGGGRFFDAQDRDALAAAIRKTLAMPFEVLDGRGRQAATGLTDQEGMDLYQGDYSVIAHTAKGDVTVRDVRIVEGKATEVVLARDEDGIRVRVSAPQARE